MNQAGMISHMTRQTTMPMDLLPQEPMPITAEQHALTVQFLLPAQPDIFEYLTQLRNLVDPILSTRLPPANGKAYPLGRCREISDAVRAELRARLQQPCVPAERAILAFLRAGGIIRPIWGVLRDQYFQNATQFGSLYIDVSNDTVVVTKPKVEILPMECSGLRAIRDLHDLRDIAAKYWDAAIYANHIVPSLAPILPAIGIWHKDGKAELQSATDYMIAMLMRERFAASEQWVRDLPPPPPEQLAPFLARLPARFQRPEEEDGRTASIAACQAARAAGHFRNNVWRDARVLDFQAILKAQAL
jgi:hypothetical protein